MKPKLFLLVFVIFSTLLAACGVPEIGNHLIAKHGLNAVTDWNSLTKPTCRIVEGAEVETLDVSTKSRGYSDQETIILVKTIDESCTAWDFPENFRAKP